jgi:hypothetical protein
MDRRTVLTTVGALLCAGCSARTGKETTQADSTAMTTEPTPPRETISTTGTATETSTGTPTVTPTPQPRIETFRTITNGIDFEEDGIAAHGTPAYGRGADAYFAFEVVVPPKDETVQYAPELTIESDGQEVASYSGDTTSERTNETVRNSHWIRVATETDWDITTYSARLRVRDERHGESAAATESFELTFPFDREEVELVEDTLPDEITTGETLDYSLTFRNRSDRASSIVSPISMRDSPESWAETGGTFTLNIAAGETRTWHSEETQLETPGRYEYRLDDVGTTFGFTVEE